GYPPSRGEEGPGVGGLRPRGPAERGGDGRDQRRPRVRREGEVGCQHRAHRPRADAERLAGPERGPDGWQVRTPPTGRKSRGWRRTNGGPGARTGRPRLRRRTMRGRTASRGRSTRTTNWTPP